MVLLPFSCKVILPRFPAMMNTQQFLSLAMLGATGMLCSAEEYGAFHVTPLHDNVRMVHGQQLSPQDAVADIRMSGWRGERVTAQFAACWETSEDYSTVITVYVIYEGRINGEFKRNSMDDKHLGLLMVGGTIDHE